MTTKRVRRWRTAMPATPGMYLNRYAVGDTWIERAFRVQSVGSAHGTNGTANGHDASEDLTGILLGGSDPGDEVDKPLSEWGGQWMGPFEHQAECDRLTTAKRRSASRKAKASAPPWRNVLGYREKLGEKQLVFWTRFGVSQSAGSRYETSNRPMPAPLEMLIAAYDMGLLTEESMEMMRQAVTGTPKPRRRRMSVETADSSAAMAAAI